MKKAIEYIIRAKDATGAGIKSAMGRIKSLATGIGRNLANIHAGLSMLMGAAQKFASVFAKAIGEAFKFEKATSDFKVLLGSIDKAKEHMADLRSFAASTPLTFEDLAKSSKLLLSFGASVDEVMPAMKMLGDIAMGDAQKFQGLSLVFAQVRSQGKLMGQDLLQMINQGFNPLTVISKETGKSMSELKDMMGDGKISFEMVAEAMRLATSEGGLFHNAMKEASQTGEGLMSTLSDNWTDAVRTFGDAFSGTAKNGIQVLIDALQKLKEDGAIERWAEGTAKALKNVIGPIAWLTKLGGSVWGGIKGTLGTAGAFVAGADQALSEGKGFWDQIKAGKAIAGEYWNREFNGGAQAERELEEQLYGLKKTEPKTEPKNDRSIQTPKTLEDMVADAMAEDAAKAADKKAKEAAEQQKKIQEEIDAAEKAARKAAEAEEKERLRIEKAIAAERERLRKAEMKAYERELTKAHQTAQEKDAAAKDRLSAAEEKARQAWGWYRDKDSLSAQLEEERAEAAAQKQFEKDFEKLRFRRDWRTAAAYGSGKMGALSLDEEAVRRVVLAREEEAAAKEYARQTAEECARSAAALEAIQNTICTEG